MDTYGIVIVQIDVLWPVAHLALGVSVIKTQTWLERSTEKFKRCDSRKVKEWQSTD